MKERIYNLTECDGFDAFEIIERWAVGNKWYEKQTTTYKHRGTLGVDFTLVEWVVYSFKYDAKGKMYCIRTQLHRETIC